MKYYKAEVLKTVSTDVYFSVRDEVSLNTSQLKREAKEFAEKIVDDEWETEGDYDCFVVNEIPEEEALLYRLDGEL